MKKITPILFTLLFITTFFLTSRRPQARAQFVAPPIFLGSILGATDQSAIPTEKNFKVAFIGDTGYTYAYDDVLHLIIDEETDMVLHQGDFAYTSSVTPFINMVKDHFDIPYLGSVGNHDLLYWGTDNTLGCQNQYGCYAQFFKDQIDLYNIAVDNSDLNDYMYSTEYKGLKTVFVGQNPTEIDIYADYLNSQLLNTEHIWKICSWHRTQTAMQVGGKGNEMGWDVYENCRKEGAAILEPKL
jgi:hypothetical protein